MLSVASTDIKEIRSCLYDEALLPNILRLLVVTQACGWVQHAKPDRLNVSNAYFRISKESRTSPFAIGAC